MSEKNCKLPIICKLPFPNSINVKPFSDVAGHETGQNKIPGCYLITSNEFIYFLFHLCRVSGPIRYDCARDQHWLVHRFQPDPLYPLVLCFRSQYHHPTKGHRIFMPYQSLEKYPTSGLHKGTRLGPYQFCIGYYYLFSPILRQNK